MGGGARALVRQLKTAVFLRKSPKSGGSKSVNLQQEYMQTFLPQGHLLHGSLRPDMLHNVIVLK